MIRLAYLLWTYIHRDRLGGWLPMPVWLRKYFDKLPLQKQIHTYAKLMLGKDLSIMVMNEVGCAESVSRILMELSIMPRIIAGTYTLYEYLNTSPRFMKVTVPQAGDIIISPTGMGNHKIQGHIGIMDSNNRILSNDSWGGKWSSNYTITTWNARYKVLGGLPVFFYRIIK